MLAGISSRPFSAYLVYTLSLSVGAQGNAAVKTPFQCDQSSSEYGAMRAGCECHMRITGDKCLKQKPLPLCFACHALSPKVESEGN